MTVADDDKTNDNAPKLSPLQEQFLRQRVDFLDHQIRLLGLGKTGVARVLAELREERDTHRRTLGLNPIPEPTKIEKPKKAVLVTLDGRPLGEKS